MIEEDVGDDAPKDTFRRAIWASFILHAALAFVTFTRAFFAPSEPLDLQDAIRVDIVGLPQKMAPDEPLPPEPETPPPPKPEPAAPPPPPPPAPEPPKPAAPKFVEKPKPEPKVKPDVRHDQKDAFAKLRAMEALANMKREAEEREAADKRARAPKPKLIAGHVVTKGNALTGLERLNYDRYGAELKARLLTNWRVPSWLAEAELRAKVRVWLDDQGQVTKKQVFLSSGNEVFDQAALDAVDASNPFPPPPENLRGVLAAEGFTLGLPK